MRELRSTLKDLTKKSRRERHEKLRSALGDFKTAWKAYENSHFILQELGAFFHDYDPYRGLHDVVVTKKFAEIRSRERDCVEEQYNGKAQNYMFAVSDQNSKLKKNLELQDIYHLLYNGPINSGEFKKIIQGTMTLMLSPKPFQSFFAHPEVFHKAYAHLQDLRPELFED